MNSSISLSSSFLESLYWINDPYRFSSFTLNSNSFCQSFSNAFSYSIVYYFLICSFVNFLSASNSIFFSSSFTFTFFNRESNSLNFKFSFSCSSSSWFICLRTSCESPPYFFLKGDSATGRCSSFWYFFIPTYPAKISKFICFDCCIGSGSFNSGSWTSYFTSAFFLSWISSFFTSSFFSSYLASTFLSSFLSTFWMLSIDFSILSCSFYLTSSFFAGISYFFSSTFFSSTFFSSIFFSSYFFSSTILLSFSWLGNNF